MFIWSCQSEQPQHDCCSAEETAANRDPAISLLCMHRSVKFSYTRLHLFRLDGAALSDMSWALSNMMMKEIKEKPVVRGRKTGRNVFEGMCITCIMKRYRYFLLPSLEVQLLLHPLMKGLVCLVSPSSGEMMNGNNTVLKFFSVSVNWLNKHLLFNEALDRKDHSQTQQRITKD